MKTKKNYQEDFRTKKEVESQGYDKKQMTHRRPVKNWTKTYLEHETEVDELDDFHVEN